eukprot:TRINITY_DN29792_c0_g1_i1.p1 TRINITY_DN29792_c0_g1~~TRINITY_DN29792_c0_g1_i1.p1  ORF type:complete len:1004 (+),score=542.61 TRINITY_DN29792_c0_g1_i1:41-3052(+)
MPGKRIAARGAGAKGGGGRKGGKGGKGGKAKKGGSGVPRRLRRGDDVSLTSDEMSADAIIEDDESIDSDEAFGPEDDDLKKMFEEIDSREQKGKALKAADSKLKGAAKAPKAVGKKAAAAASKMEEEERIYGSDESVSEGSSFESDDDGSDTGMIDISDLLDGPVAAKQKKQRQAPKIAETQKEGQFESSSLRTIDAPSLADLVGQTVDAAGDTAGEGMARISKKLKKLQEKEALAIGTPEDNFTVAERDRELTRAGVDKDLGSWSQLVHHQRAKDFSQFPLPEPEAIPKATTTNAGEVIKPSNDMEKEIDALLAGSGLKGEAEKELNSADFVKLEGDVFGLADKGQDGNTAVGRLKTILSSEHDRKRRVKKIKSKTYRRMVRKEKEKEKDKRLELLALVDPQAALQKKKDEMLKLRAKERMTQKHKNKSQWIKHVKHMAKWDPETRNAMTNQNRIHNQLMQKMDESIEQAAYNKAGSDEDMSSGDEDDQQIDTLLTEGGSKSALWNLRKDIEEGDGEKKKGVWGMKFMRRNDEKQKEDLLRMVDALEDDVDRYRKGEEPIGEEHAEDAAPAEAPSAAKQAGKMSFDGGEEDAPKKKGRAAARAAAQAGKPVGNTGAAFVTDDSKGEDVAAGAGEDAEPSQKKRKRGAVEAKLSKASAGELEVEVDEELLQKAAKKSAMAKAKAAEHEAQVAAAEEIDTDAKPAKRRKLVRRVVVKRRGSAKAVSGSEAEGMTSEASSAATPKAAAAKKLLRKRGASAVESGEDGFTEKKAKKSVSFSQKLDDADREVPVEAPAAAKKPAKKKAKKGAEKKAEDGVLETDDGVVMTQDYLIGRAFAADTLAAEFQKEKDADIEKDVEGVDVSEALPGWGEWGGEDEQLNERSKARRAELEAERSEKVAKLRKKRKDAKLNHVILNENEDAVDSKYTLSKVPYPYRSAEQYEASMVTPLGSDWNTETRASLHVRPKMKVKKGAIITPLEKEQGTRKSPKTKRRKMAKKGQAADE